MSRRSDEYMGEGGDRGHARGDRRPRRERGPGLAGAHVESLFGMYDVQRSSGASYLLYCFHGGMPSSLFK